MNRLLAALLVFSALAATLRADDVALMEIRTPGDKALHSVAIEFYPAEAPATVDNFKKLAHKRFYNGLTFHRVFPHTLVQVGDPLTAHKDRTNVGTGGPGYTLLPEIRRKHTAGAVAMARLPDKINPSRLSNGSQFFICLKPMPEYDGQYTVFGRVLYGLDTLDSISTLTVDSNDNPIQRIVVKSLRIVPREKLPGPPVPPAPGQPTPTKPAKKPWWKVW
jgi:peptidyl-prolyl cis-trans isomerase B (cyclophilin B)